MTEFKKDNNSHRRVAKETIGSQLMDIGKLPPQATELEEAVLGAILLESNVLSEIVDMLKPESFYRDSHSRIYNAIISLYQDNKPVDILTVIEQLKKTAELDIVGGAYAISILTNRVASSANCTYHAEIIAQKFTKREAIRISSDIIRNAYEEETDSDDLLEFAQQGFYEINNNTTPSDLESTRSLVKKEITRMEEAAKAEDGLIGIPSGYIDLDRITNGFQEPDLIILAARPAMGKTAFVLNVARNAAVEFKHPVAFFSLEMSKQQLIGRLISSEVEINSHRLKKGKLVDYEWDEIHAKVNKLLTEYLFIDDTPALSIMSLRSKARRFKEKHGCKLVVVDYLQLMTGKADHKGNREQEIAFISRSLKVLAKELNVPVIALSQLSRAVESRGGDKRPVLSDLRESGAIEQDADMVMFIHRPEYYGVTEDSDGNSTIGLAEIIIAKYRNGDTNNVKLKYISKYVKFTDWDRVEPSINPNKGIEPSKEWEIITPIN